MREETVQDIMARTGVQFGTSGVRGLEAAMTDEVCYAYVSAFLRTLARDTEYIVIGHDLRPSSLRIAAACAAAVVHAGKKVVYAGTLPTPAVALFAGQLGAPAMVVTGSHIPFDRNGIKFYRATGEITKADEQAIMNVKVPVSSTLPSTPLPAPDRRAYDAYVQRYLDFFGHGALLGMTVAVYEHSSVARDMVRDLLARLGARVISLGRTDTFVPIDTEAVREEDRRQAQQWAAMHRFDAIVSTDGDADRPLIGDENGQWLRGDVVGILCAQYLQADVVVTPISSNTAVEKCKSFAQVIRTRIGSPYVIAAMQASQADKKGHAIVGYEANGGFLLGTDIEQAGQCITALPTRDAMLPILALLTMARARKCALSALMQGLPRRYTASDRIQDFPVTASSKLLEDLKQDAQTMQEVFTGGVERVRELNETDGVRATLASGDILHVRPSGNAPELRCYAEADSQERANFLCQACLQRIVKMYRAGNGR